MKKYVVLILLLITIRFVSYSQEKEIVPDSIQHNDSLPVRKDLSTFDLLHPNEVPVNEMLFSPPDTFGLNFSSEFRNPAFGKIDIKNLFLPLEYYSSEHLIVSPLRFGFYNRFEGGDLLGVNNHFLFTDFLSGNLNFTFSSSFYGPVYPQRYNNGSVSLNLTWQLHDRIRINTFGEYSRWEGMDPRLSPVINGGRYYGGEIQIKIAKNFGIGMDSPTVITGITGYLLLSEGR